LKSVLTQRAGKGVAQWGIVVDDEDSGGGHVWFGQPAIIAPYLRTVQE
jgi:hypothetical protein